MWWWTRTLCPVVSEILFVKFILAYHIIYHFIINKKIKLLYAKTWVCFCETSFKWDRIFVISMWGEDRLHNFDSVVLLGGRCRGGHRESWNICLCLNIGFAWVQLWQARIAELEVVALS